MSNKHKLSQRRNLFILFMVLPAVILPMIFTYYPLIAGSKMAFYSYNLFNINNIKFVGLDNFKNLFEIHKCRNSRKNCHSADACIKAVVKCYCHLVKIRIYHDYT